MKKVLRFVLMISIISLFVSISACSNSYNEMIDGFNAKYFSLTPTPPIENSINDSGFNQETMLEVRYTFIEGYESTLPAPLGGASYSWKKMKHDGTFEEPALCEERIFTFVPEESFEINAETKLVLTVTNEAGTEYIDTTIIIVLNRE